MIVLDASVLIAQLESRDSHHHRVAEVLLEHNWGELVATVITVAEVLVGPVRSGSLPRALAALDKLEVRTLVADPSAAMDLATIRAETGLKLPDCCVLQAAEKERAALATFDDRLARVALARGTRVAGY